MKNFIIALIAGIIISNQITFSFIFWRYTVWGSYGDEDLFYAIIFGGFISLGLGLILALIFFFLVLSKETKSRKKYNRFIQYLILVIVFSIFCRVYLNEKVVPALVSTAAFEPNSYLKILVKFSYNLNVKDLNGQTAIIKASERGRLDSVKELIKAGADLNAQDRRGWTALIVAAYGTGFPETDNCELTELLIKAGADINIEDNWGNNALTNALSVGNTCSANLLQQQKDNLTTN